jgi:UDP-3-O-[3-hydroxymyristoyl] N-acetylglucosamine deacetylase/3-hydroxyacyl-[acyl-carrier-protein] dehydratase
MVHQIFCRSIEKQEEQNAKRNVYGKEVISFTDEATGAILVMPSDHFSVTTMVDFGTKILGTQMPTLNI